MEKIMKNAIFQYMVVTPEVDDRGDIKGHNRSALYKDVAQVSKNSFERYADKIGADYYYSDELKFIDTTDSTALLFECLRVIYDPMFDQYDKVLFADTDIGVNTEENIFDQCEGADVYGVLESDIISGNGGGYASWDSRKRTLLNFVSKFNMHNIPIVPSLPPQNPSKLTIMNTGVVVWEREARLFARKHFMDWKEWFYAEPQYHMSIMNDQPYLSGQFLYHDMEIGHLDQKWNDSPHYSSDDEFFEKANFCHYTGGEWKLDMLKHEKEGRFL